MDRAIKIRRALVADADAVHAVLLAAKDEIPLTCNFETDKYRAWVRDQCKKREVWLATIDDKVAGVMVMRVYEIFYLVTAPDFQRAGVGRALVRHAIGSILKRYPGGGVIAKARPENSPIIALLTGEGFRPHQILTAQPGWPVYFVGKIR